MPNTVSRVARHGVAVTSLRKPVHVRVVGAPLNNMESTTYITQQSKCKMSTLRILVG